MNYKNIMQQAQAMQAQMATFQEKVKTFEATGTSGGGLVKVTLSGQGNASKVEIDDSLLMPGEKDVLEDLLVAAFNDARQKIEQMTADEMAKITGGMQLPPGLNFPGM